MHITIQSFPGKYFRDNFFECLQVLKLQQKYNELLLASLKAWCTIINYVVTEEMLELKCLNIQKLSKVCYRFSLMTRFEFYFVCTTCFILTSYLSSIYFEYCCWKSVSLVEITGISEVRTKNYNLSISVGIWHVVPYKSTGDIKFKVI